MELGRGVYEPQRDLTVGDRAEPATGTTEAVAARAAGAGSSEGEAAAGRNPRHPYQSSEVHAAPPSRQRPRRPWTRTASRRRHSAGLAGSTRTRVVAAYLVLLVVTVALTTFGIRSVLVISLDHRIDESLQQEIAEVGNLRADGLDPLTGEPFASLDRLFDVYLDRNVPNVEEAFMTFVGDDVFRDRLRSFPGREIPAPALETWAAFASTNTGENELTGDFATPLGSARFHALRVGIGGETGAFVVTILPAAARGEIERLQTYGTLIALGVVLLAGVCAWFLAGRVLAPVYALTATARSISESDRTTRVPVGRSGEAAEMAATFNAMLDRLDAASRSRLEFLRAAGHELRTPLTVATGHLELLDDQTPGQQATLALVLDELARMGHIIDHLHSLAVADGADFLEPAPLDASLLAAELLAKAAALGERRWLLDAAEAGTFVADREWITEAVLNLADNAVKHTDVSDTIAVGVAVVGEEARIWVRDTGTGVSELEREQIFERFSRGRDSRLRYRGAGLGLAVVVSIAEAHDGRVELDSRPGAGATFTIIVPREGPS